MKMLTEDLGFLETTARNPLGVYIYRIDIETIEQYVSEHLKEKLRQLTLLTCGWDRKRRWEPRRFSVCVCRETGKD